VALLGGGPPGWHVILQGLTPEGKNLRANLLRIVDKRGRTRRWWLKKVASFPFRKKWGDTSVAAPGDTHPSDATGRIATKTHRDQSISRPLQKYRRLEENRTELHVLICSRIIFESCKSFVSVCSQHIFQHNKTTTNLPRAKRKIGDGSSPL